MQVQLILDNEELDVNMRHADCAIRLRQPQQSDLIQRKLFTVHMHVYAAPASEPPRRAAVARRSGQAPHHHLSASLHPATCWT